MALCHSQVTLMLCADITLQKPHIPASFNMYLVINKLVIAVKVSNFSGKYLQNHWTLDIGVLGYIGIVWPKEHSPEISHIPPITPCICVYWTCSCIHTTQTCASQGLRVKELYCWHINNYPSPLMLHPPTFSTWFLFMRVSISRTALDLACLLMSHY